MVRTVGLFVENLGRFRSGAALNGHRRSRGRVLTWRSEPGDLVLCSGTLPRTTPFRLRLEAAVGGGVRGGLLWGRDYAAARAEGYGDADIVAMLADHGLAVAELDPAWWWTPGAASFSIPPELDPIDVFRFDERELFRIGELVGARSLNAADVLGGAGASRRPRPPSPRCATVPQTTACWCISNGWRGRGSPTSPPPGMSCAWRTGPTVA